VHETDRVLVGLDAIIVMIAVFLAVGAGIVGFYVGRGTAGSDKASTQPTTTSAASPAGKAVFASAGCGNCHTLKAAGSTGTVGPNLDDAHPSRALVVNRVTNGKGGMPSFKGQLTTAQIQAVAQFVSTGK
jgi:mono/diheme cytochrome c family protein